ncbi:MAG: HPP family protein [Desulfobacterales bacterium]
MLSAIVGVTAYQYLGGQPWFAAAMAASVSIALMHLTKTLHPPGGATALIAVIGGDSVYNLGYLYAIIPVAIGAGAMLTIAMIVNNKKLILLTRQLNTPHSSCGLDPASSFIPRILAFARMT